MSIIAGEKIWLKGAGGGKAYALEDFKLSKDTEERTSHTDMVRVYKAREREQMSVERSRVEPFVEKKKKLFNKKKRAKEAK